MTLITSTYKYFCTLRKEEKLPIYSPVLPLKIPAHNETQTPSSSNIGVDLYLIDIREFPNNLNMRDLFLTMCGHIKKLQIREVNNVIVHVFFERVTHHFDETFNSLDSRTNRNDFLKPSMIYHPLYHSNRVSNSCQPKNIN